MGDSEGGGGDGVKGDEKVPVGVELPDGVVLVVDG